MYENWFKEAHPGLPRMAAWALACLLCPLFLGVAALLMLLETGLNGVPAFTRSLADGAGWLRRQRITLHTDPWRPVR
jgi:hypothetical protein